MTKLPELRKKEIGQVWLNTLSGNEIKIVQARPDICADNLILIELVNEKGQSFFINECEMPSYIFSGGNEFTNSKNKTKVWSEAYEEYFAGFKIDKYNRFSLKDVLELREKREREKRKKALAVCIVDGGRND